MHTYLIEMLGCRAWHGKLEWNVTAQNGDRIETADARCHACVGEAHPTSIGVVLDGARVDGLPAAATGLEWRVLLGTGSMSSAKQVAP